MDPQAELPQVPQDPTFQAIVAKLVQFYKTELPADETGMVVKTNAENIAQDVLIEAIGMVERFAQQRSSIAKYDLLKWLGNKRQEVRLYK